MYIATFNRSLRVYEIFQVNEETGEKSFTHARTTKEHKGVALLSLNAPQAYRRAVAAFGKDVLLRTPRFISAAEMYADGNLPTQVTSNRFLVRSQDYADEGQVYTVVTGDFHACSCDDYQCRTNLPILPGTQAPACKHLALVHLVFGV